MNKHCGRTLIIISLIINIYTSCRVRVVLEMNERLDGLVTAFIYYPEREHNRGGVINTHRVTNLFG